MHYSKLLRSNYYSKLFGIPDRDKARPEIRVIEIWVAFLDNFFNHGDLRLTHCCQDIWGLDLILKILVKAIHEYLCAAI